MELDDFKRSWEAHDRKLDTLIRLNQDILRHAVLDRARRPLRRLSGLLSVGLLFDVLTVAWLGSFLWDHAAEARFFLPAAALDLCAILLLALRIRQLTILARIDYGAPILAMQKTLAELRIDRIRTTMLTLVVAPLLWPPLLVVGFKALLGVDAYAAFGLPWLLANLAFGVLVILVARWIARRYAGRFDSSPLAQRLMRDLAGYNLSAAMDKLSSLAAFEA